MSDSYTKKAIGIIDGVNVNFQTPLPYFPGSLFAYINGILVEQDGDEGPIESGGVDVTMRIAPQLDDTLHFWYQTSPSPGLLFKPPSMLQAIDLAPKATMALELIPHPDGVETDVDSGESVPRTYQAVDLSPKATEAKDLVPQPFSAEEV